MTRTALLAVIILLLSVPAVAERQPAPGTADPRVRTIVYNPRDVVHVLGHYGYQTLIQFADYEQIENISIGDSLAWQVVPNERGNLLFVKPVEANAETNLTVITARPSTNDAGGTEQRVYVFSLSAREADSHHRKDFTWVVQFHYPDDDVRQLIRTARRQRLKDTAIVGDDSSVDPTQWNFNYSFAGSQSHVPVKIFDNGTFTYFEFDPRTDTPAIFLVDDKQQESLVNGIRQGQYVVVHRVGRQFTLRNGDVVTCIFNDGYPDAPALDQGSPTERVSATKRHEAIRDGHTS